MSSFATKPDRFQEFGLTRDQFVHAYEIAKVRFHTPGFSKEKASDHDVLNYLSIDKDQSIVSKIKAGYPAGDITKKLLYFTSEFAPGELPEETHTLLDIWAANENKNGVG